MNRSRSLRTIPSVERDDLSEEQRAISHPNLGGSLGSSQMRSKSTVDELRRKIIRLNKELEEERICIKQLRREKLVDLKHVKEEEQRRAASQLTELRTKLYKEREKEITLLREQLHKEKQREILQISKQKDEAFKTTQLAWQKEKDELRLKARAEIWSDAREESRKEFDRERTKLEQEILDLKMQKKEIEESLKIVQESDKRKADDIRRIFHEHDINMEKFKRNSWQESRRQMAEIRQLLNIIEQLERKLGLDSGHINKLRMEKEGLYDELRRKTTTFDAWNNMMSTTDNDGSSDPKYHNANQELRTLQRKNIELSSLVKKLDEKNQQLATRNAELSSELERCEKEARDRNRKLEKKNLDLAQNAKKLESRNKSLVDEINSLKKKNGPANASKDGKKAVRPRGQAGGSSDSAEVVALKEQIKDLAKTIEELKQSLVEKERRIDLLKERKRNGKKLLKTGRSLIDAGIQPDQDDVSSVVSDVSDLSEISSDSNSDANKLKKLTKELLALERAYAILQAQVGSTVDVEREELERQQLQSDLIESQARINELERMMDSNLQGGTEEIQALQQDNQVLYQKLVVAEAERDEALNELSKNTEDLKDLQDKKDLLEFELEEMSQLSFAGSEDEFSPRKIRDKDGKKLPLSLEEVKAHLEEMENEKSDVLNDIQLEALRQARTSLTAMPQKISHLEATEAILRSKVKDLEERPMDAYGTITELDESLDNSLIRDNTTEDDKETSTDITLDDMAYFEDLEIKHHELVLQTKQDNAQGSITLDKNSKPIHVNQQTDYGITLKDMNFFDQQEMGNLHEIQPVVRENVSFSGNIPQGIPGNGSIEPEICHQGTWTELTLDDMDHFENVDLDYQELLMEKEGLIAEKERLIALVCTHQKAENGISRSDFEDLELECNELRAENEHLKELLSVFTDKQKYLLDKDVETELSLEDISKFEKLELTWKDFKAQSNREVETLTVEYNKLNQQKSSTELLLKQVEQAHQTFLNKQENCLEKAVETEMTLDVLSNLENNGNRAGIDIDISTDLTLADIHYLEEIDAVHNQYCMAPADNDASSKTDSSDKGVVTELKSSVLDYLEEVASAHDGIVREYEAFRKSMTKETCDYSTMTEMTGEHLDYLNEMALKSEEQSMFVDDSEEDKLKQYEAEAKEMFSKQLMTELSLSDIRSLENFRQQQMQSRMSAKLSRSGYECLLDIDSTQRGHDIALMTDLTIDNLKTLENSDYLYMDLKQRGVLSRIEDFEKPKKEHSVITDLLFTNIEHLEYVQSLYNEQERRKDTTQDVGIETEMSQSDLTRLENIANKNHTETLVTIEASEALFGSCPRDRRGRYGRYRHNNHDQAITSADIGIQCELKDLKSLVEEEKDDADPSQWYVSSLKINRENTEGFNPVEVVLSNGRKSSTPDVSSRNHDSKRHSLIDSKGDMTSASLDYGWQSTMSLDASGIERTPFRGSAIGRWDSPRVPLAQDEVFDLSDIDTSEENLATSPRKESAVAKFDRYIMARKESEIELMTNLRGATDHTDGRMKTPRSMVDVLRENEEMRRRIVELELLVRQKGDLSDEELHLLKQKIRQLQDAEKQMEELHESNNALKDRINCLQEDKLASGSSTSRTVQDNWSEMDLSEGRTRLLLVQDWGLDETDIESLFSARDGAISPAESLETSALRRLLDEYVKSDHAAQAGPGPGVSQEIQTTGDLLKLIDLSYDGTIPDHIAKELEKLKTENKQLYQELVQLRQLKLENSKSLPIVRGVPPSETIEEPVTSSVQVKSESHNDWMTILGVSHCEKPQVPPIPNKAITDLDEDFFEKSPSNEHQHPHTKVHEPEIKTSSTPRDAWADINLGISHLNEMDDVRVRANGDILDFDLNDASPPDTAPPPIPSEPPPDIEPMHTAYDSVFDSAPLRDSKTLRAATRSKPLPGTLPEATIQPVVQSNVEGQHNFLGQTDIPPAPRVSQTPSNTRSEISRPPSTPKPVPPPTLPKPKMGGAGRRQQGAVGRPGLLSTPLRRSNESLAEDSDGFGLTPRGYVRATASAINQGEIDALSEKINFLEKQLKNKEGVIRSMKAEATEIENKALVERKDREIKILEEDVAFLKQENQKKEREVLVKIGEINRKSYEVDQWKSEATNAEKQRKRIESTYMNLQSQARNLLGANSKLTDLQAKYSSLEKDNQQLLDKVSKLEKTEKEFKQLEYNISVLQNHLQDMESVEKERDQLIDRLKTVENQRDDLLKKGRMVESERNDFLRNNKIMEMQRDELEQRYAMAHEELMNLKSTAGDLKHSIKEAENSSLDAKHERNYLQAQYKKLEGEKISLEQQLAAVSRERNALETRLAELEDRNREYLKLEDGFHTLRLKVAELTRQRDDFESQIPTLKAKVALLKKACKEKDEFIDKLNEEIRDLRHAIATSTLDDLSKIKSYGYSPDSFVRYSAGKKDQKITTEDGKGSGKPRGSRKSPFPKRCIALFDYNPMAASVSGQPDKELTLKEGDQLTLLSDMDTNGCHKAELNGVRGLVPGLYVEGVGEGLDSNSAPEGAPVANGKAEPDVVSNGHPNMSPRSTASDLDLHKQCFVALFDYDPYQSCTTGQPELELPFKKGDIMTVYGDVDASGYYRAEMEGQTGLVPSNFVEEVSSSTYLQPASNSSTAPQQILTMFDNIKVPTPQRPGPTFPLPIPPNPSPNPVPIQPTLAPFVSPNQMTAPSTNAIVPSSNVARLNASPERSQSIEPIFTPYMTPAEVHRLAAPIVTSKSHDTAAHRPSSRAISMSKRSPKQPLASPPRITSQVQNNSLKPVNKPKPRQSKASVPRSPSSRGPPRPPSNLHVIRPVNHDAILLGWVLPDMDEFGLSNGTSVKGYKICVNGEYKMDIRSQFMTKALVDDLDLRYPIQFSICTIGEGSTLSTEASTTFTDTINNARMSVGRAMEGTIGSSGHCRTFIALYDYDPMKSSPNANPQYELQFHEGDILRVEDTTRKDGFYFGALNGKKGLIPSNFIEEVAIAKARGPSSPTRKQHDSPRSSSLAGNVVTSPRQRKNMIALYDYNPKQQSPLENPDWELPFKKGQSITISGPMNKDGFYKATIDGRQGLVPASFLESSLELSQSTQKLPRSS